MKDLKCAMIVALRSSLSVILKAGIDSQSLEFDLVDDFDECENCDIIMYMQKLL